MCASWAHRPMIRRTASDSSAVMSVPPSVTVPAAGSRNRSSTMASVVLPAAARPDHGDPLPGGDVQVETAQHVGAVRLPARAQPPDRAGRRAASGSGAGSARLGDRIGLGQHGWPPAPPADAQPRHLLRGGRQPGEHLVRGQRHQHHHRERHPGQRRLNAPPAPPAPRRPHTAAPAASMATAAPAPCAYAERASPRATPRSASATAEQRTPGRAEGRQFAGAAQQVEGGGGELAAARRDLALGPAGDAQGDRGRGHGGGEQADRQDQARRRAAARRETATAPAPASAATA